VNPEGFDAGANDAGASDPNADDARVGDSYAEDLFAEDGAGVGPYPPDVFAGVVFDEAFVLSALIHEPSAEERLRALRNGGRKRGRAVQTARVPGTATGGGGVRAAEGGLGGITVRRGRHQALPGRWQRAVARLMLVMIGVLTVLVAAAAVYRGTGPTNQPAQHPGTGAGGSSTTSTVGATVHP
jgi:hypothetical protein